MPNWNAIKAFYLRHQDKILRSASEWGVTPYSWEVDAGVTFTPIESAFWSDIRMEGAVLYPQYPVSRFFVDFANPVARVAIECDGKLFHTDKEKDARRDEELTELGWTVYRFTGSECMKDTEYEEDEDGYEVVVLAPVRLALRNIVDIHRIRVGLDRMQKHFATGRFSA